MARPKPCPRHGYAPGAKRDKSLCCGSSAAVCQACVEELNAEEVAAPAAGDPSPRRGTSSLEHVVLTERAQGHTLPGGTDVSHRDSEVRLHPQATAFLQRRRPARPREPPGSLVTACGDRYKGDVRDGRPCGWGTVTYASHRSWFEGEWDDTGQMHGDGALVLFNGNAYCGGWHKGRKSGQGAYFFTDGSHYRGVYRDGKRSGAGTMRYASGATYTGDWLEGNRHGRGTLTLADGSFFEGLWENDKRHGHGLFVAAADGDQYVGDWVDGRQEGRGTLTHANGDWYEGEFRAGVPHGKGVMQHGALRYRGDIRDGRWSGSGSLELTRGGDRFHGTWQDGLPVGRGTWTFAGGEEMRDCSFESGYRAVPPALAAAASRAASDAAVAAR